MKTIGMLTIGQSPRNDILPELKSILGEGYAVLEAGALDDLTLEDIENIKIAPDDYVLVSRMRDGREIKITKRFVLNLLQDKLNELEADGVRLTIIMCTGKFPVFDSKGLVVTPSEILKGVLEGTLKKGRLGVIYPAEEQLSGAKSSFGREGVEVYADHISPYEAEDELGELTERLGEQSLDLILLNCFGFDSNMKKVIAEKTGVPVIQSNSVVARVLKELAG